MEAVAAVMAPTRSRKRLLTTRMQPPQPAHFHGALVAGVDAVEGADAGGGAGLKTSSLSSEIKRLLLGCKKP